MTNKPVKKGRKTKTSRRKTIAERAAALQRRQSTAGVVIMLAGMMFLLWQVVLYFTSLRQVSGFSQAMLVLLSACGNLAVGAAALYGGLLLYKQKKAPLYGWPLLGLICFVAGIMSLLHRDMVSLSIAGAWRAALRGEGGGIIGFLTALLFNPLPDKFALILLWALIILGFFLFTDFKIFFWLRHGAYYLLAACRGAKETLKLPEEAKAEPAAQPAFTQLTLGDNLPPLAKPDAQSKTAEDLAPLIINYGGGGDLVTEVLTPPETAAAAALMPRVTGTAAAEAKEDLVSAIDNKANKTADAAEAVQPPAALNGTHLPKSRKVPAETAKTETVADPLSGGGGENPPYVLPAPSLLKNISHIKGGRNNKDIISNSTALEQVLMSFGVQAKVVQVVSGPAVTRYELQPAPGVKVAKIVNLADDIALALAAKGLRIEAPVPGKAVVGIEIAKNEVAAVHFRNVVESDIFKNSTSLLSLALGVDITGSPVVADLAKMPHLLIAGATGSGKSVCMNTIIASLLFKARPQDVKIIMIDPKKVELSSYKGLPHLGRPVVTDPQKASLVLKEVVAEMDRRYSLFAAKSVKNYEHYNELPNEQRLPQIIVLIDELSDLMMVAARDVEDSICRLAQMARAAGIHLVVATQRPSVDVITGLIKANIPSRIAFFVSSQVDSRTILDMAGAEKLLGKGDMLFYPTGMSKPIRVQGAFLDEEDIEKLVSYCQAQGEQEFLELPETAEMENGSAQGAEEEDSLFYDAVQQVMLNGQASASFLQRRFRIGYNRAARLVESMEQKGIVGPLDGNKRPLMMTWEQFIASYEADKDEKRVSADCN